MSKNHARATILAAPASPTTSTTLTVQSGQGQLLYAGVAWITAGTAEPAASNTEVVLITAVTGDDLTVVRAQEGSTRQPVGAGWTVRQGITAGLWDGLISRINSLDARISALEATVFGGG